MAELLHQASDDQIALAICLGAVSFCGLIMYFSHHVGRLTGHVRLHETSAEGARSAHESQTLSALPLVQPAQREKAA